MRGFAIIGLLVGVLGASRAAAQDPNGACATPDPASPDAERCAAAALDAARAAARAFDGFHIVVAPPGIHPQTSIDDIVRQIQEGSAQAQRFAQGFEPVMGWRRPAHTIAALVAQARLYERLAWAILHVQLSPPEVATQVRAAMAPQVAPVECLAVDRYLLAVRGARAGRLHLPDAEAALQRLGAYGPARLAQCAADQQTRDRTFSAFIPSDLDPLP